jgi:hypothetical protein
MTARPKPKPSGINEAEADRLNAGLLQAAFDLDVPGAVAALEDGADVATAHEETGLTALHIAAGTDNLALAKILIGDWNAPFGPDRFGRWPTAVAAECEAGEELCDYIVEQEALFLQRQSGAGSGGE